MAQLTHLDSNDKPAMVDVGDKTVQKRVACATGKIKLSNEVLALIQENKIKKGNVLTTSEIAGILGGKKTSDLIPLCHQLNLRKLDVTASIECDGVKVTATAKCNGQTGVEMEALTATSIALLNIYDMCKAVDKNMVIESIRLISKTKEDI